MSSSSARRRPGIARVNALIQAFLAIVCKRRAYDLEAWMAAAIHSGIAELACFARGRQDDLRAIKAGLTLEWSNEHIAYCTSSPASSSRKVTDTLTATA